MKSIVLPVALALACTCAWAQDKPAAKPKAEKAKVEKPKAAEKSAEGKKSRRHEDARACLEKGSNTEIIKCAEAYL
ncbi:MAG: hypothetical protein ACM30H_05725 [Clostridia bacterium]